MKKYLLPLLAIMLCSAIAEAQNVPVDGMVTDVHALQDTVTTLRGYVIDLQELIQGYAYGRTKVATTTEDLNQAAASYTLFTGTTADVVLQSLTLRNANVDCSDDATITGISIQTDDGTPAIFLSQADGAIANLTAEAQLTYFGPVYIKLGSIVKMTIYGGASDATCVVDVSAVYVSTGIGTGTLEE